jgi:hypothetical protein
MLIFLTGSLAGRRFKLIASSQERKTEWTIGNHVDNDIFVPGVSRRHGRIVSDGKRWQIIDMFTIVGTFLNGKPITTASFLSSGDQVRFGSETVCRFELPSPSAHPVVPAADPEAANRTFESDSASKQDSTAHEAPQRNEGVATHELRKSQLTRPYRSAIILVVIITSLAVVGVAYWLLSGGFHPASHTLATNVPSASPPAERVTHGQAESGTHMALASSVSSSQLPSGPSSAPSSEQRSKSSAHSSSARPMVVTHRAPSSGYAEPSASDPVRNCDRLAQPTDMSRYSAFGVEFEKMDGKAAQEACEQAIRKFPFELRFKVRLGVALERLNRPGEASVQYRQAAEQGSAVAQSNLGVLYEQGHGVSQDYSEALRWYRLAAGQGTAVAQFNLGALYSSGRGVPRNDMEAAKWFRLAADQGYARAQAGLGMMYAYGRGVPQSNIDALNWLHGAANQGSAEGQADIGVIYHYGIGVPRDYAEALKWLRLAADQGFAGGQFQLGMMYEQGHGVPKDYSEAVKWYRLAANKGLPEAQKALALLGHTTP